MKTHNDYIKYYLYRVPSGIVYVYDSSKADLSLKEAFIEQHSESNRIYNLMSMELEWLFTGRYEARRDLPRSKFRKLCKRVRRRFNNLKRIYG